MGRWLKQLFCRHQWRTSPFRALNALPGEWSESCCKCGKWRHHDH